MFGRYRHRNLRVHILIIFLFLISFSSATIIAFTYHRNYDSILQLARGTIQRVSSYIEMKVECFLHNYARMPSMSVGFYQRHPGINSENRELIAYFQEMVKFHPHLYAFYTGTPDGSFLAVFNLPITGHVGYFDPKKRAPDGSTFAMIVLDRTGNSVDEEWTYLDANLKIIETEKIPNREYDPRHRPWYEGAEKAGKLYWTDLFTYDPTEDVGIAVSNPVYNEKGELIAVIGADVSIGIFTDFLVEQKIGTMGRAFILDEHGKLILPQKSNDPLSKLAQEVLPIAFEEYQQKNKKDLILHKSGIKYLVSMAPLSFSNERTWYITAVDPISDFFSGIFRTQREVVLISILILIFASLLVVYFAKKISDPIVRLSKEVRKIQHLELDSQARVSSNIIEISLMDSSISAMRSAIRSFSRYVPKEVVKQLIEHGHEIALGGENKEVTIFFSDITDFTSISEPLPPETINQMLAEYFAVLSDLILAHHGTIDKYLGDGIMAFWGAPEEVTNPTATACMTALLCREALREFNRDEKRKHRPLLSTRFGINVGHAIVGNIGTKERMNYTALGDIVNTTSRFQSLNKIYHTEIIIGDEAVKKLGGDFLIRPLDFVEIKGKKIKAKIYELMGMPDGPAAIRPTAKQTELATLFTQAYEAYHKGDLQKARATFTVLSVKFPDDVPTQIYLKKLP